MALNHPTFLYNDFWCDDSNGAVIKCSGAANIQSRPVNLKNWTGTSYVQRKGVYDGPGSEAKEIRIKITEVGDLNGSLAIQSIPTAAYKKDNNSGNGTCVVEVANGTTVPADLTLTYDGTYFDAHIQYIGSTDDDDDVILPDGTPYEIFSASMRVTITESDSAFKSGDVFYCHLRQAKYDFSVDNGVTWSGSNNLDNGNAWESNEVDFLDGSDPLLYNVYATAILQEDDTPFVVNDICYIACFYRSGTDALANQDLFKYFRSKRCDRTMLLYDHVNGTVTADFLSILHHNLTTSAVLNLIGFTGADILKSYSITGSSVGTTTIDITLGTGTWTLNEMMGGYLHIATGTAQNKAYAITGHGGGSATATFTIIGDLTADGVTSDDELLIEPPSTFADYFETDGGGDLAAMTATTYNTDFTSQSMRGWIITIADSTNTDGYIKFPICRLGEMMEPLDSDENKFECHQIIDDQSLAAYQHVQDSATNIDYRFARGIPSQGIPIDFDRVHPNVIDQLETMWLYCNGLDRARAIIFMPDSSDYSTFFYGFISNMNYGYDPDTELYGSGSFDLMNKRMT